MSLQIGKLGIIIKRRTLAKSLVLILLMVIIYLFISHYNSSSYDDNFRPNRAINWNSYLADCGRAVPVDQARLHFKKRYF